jgi:glycosyltransferase involved in cell wall biosynthesis/putative flippase GtrA
MVKIALKLAQKYKQYIKFVISGGTATLAHFTILYSLTELGLWYIFSASIGFIAAFLTSFFMQKFWTFRDNSRDRMASQMSIFFLVVLVGMLINASGMYYLVEYHDVYYLLAQVIVAAFIAVGNFFMYRFVIFKRGGAKETGISSAQAKRLLITTGIFPPDIGGPATYVKILSEELLKHGFKVTVLTYANKEIPNDKSLISNKLQNLNSKIKLVRVWREQNKLVRYIKYFWQALCLTRDADIVYTQDTVSAGLPTCVACFLRGQDFILKVVGDHAWEQGRQRHGVSENLNDFQTKKYGWQIELIKKIRTGVANHARLIITPSEYLKRIVKAWGIDEGKVRVIYNAVREASADKPREQLRDELRLKNKTIISVGRLVPWKGFDALIQLMTELDNFQLIIVGDGPEGSKLKVRSEKLKVKDRVLFTGALEQRKLWEYMRASDYYVLNTGYEGLPHVTIEAMMLGLPIITTRAGGNTEVVKDKINGLLVEYNNEKEIKEAIINLHQDPDLKSRLIQNARDGLHRFSQEKMIEAVVQLLNSL